MSHSKHLFDQAMKRAMAKQQNTSKAEPVKAAAPNLSAEEIQKYVAIIAAAAEGFHPNESTTDRLIRERLEGLAPNKKQ